MVITIEFSMPDDEYYYQASIKGPQLQGQVDEVLVYVRRLDKYDPRELVPITEVRQAIIDILCE